MKLALGTAQFGLQYGIANRRGQVPIDEAAAILHLARDSGIHTLDTAVVYGDSEQRLGEIGVSDWQVSSKLPEVPAGCVDIPAWVATSVRKSLARLQVSSLYGLLLHRPHQLLGEHGHQLYGALQRVKDDGLVHNIGVSVYDPSELELLVSRFAFDLVQAPLNILDQRLVRAGWLSRLSELGTELHVRSIFLQGVFLMSPAERPRMFDRWSSLWVEYDRWLEDCGLTPLQACVRYALSVAEIGKVVIGVDSLVHLKEILGAARGPAPDIPRSLSTDDADLLNPARWAPVTRVAVAVSDQPGT